jgi:hypothetical protein
VKDKPRVIIWDLETLPNLKEAMKVFARLSAYPGLTMKATHNSIICFGYKELGDKRAKCVNAWDFPERWSKSVNDDYDVVKFAYDILINADCIITQNGKSFDWKFLQTRLMFHGFPTLPKIQHVDTKLLAKRNLYLFNNSLDTMGKFLCNDKKLENGGWDLWVDVMNREPKALAMMSKYCKQDVDLLEKVFVKLRPFMREMPNYNIFRRDAVACCPNCGSFDLRKDGVAYTKTGTMQRVFCKSCATSFRESKKDKFPRHL